MDRVTEEDKAQFALHMASLQSGSPDSYQKRAMEQNLAAEKFIQDLEISEQRKSNRHKASLGSVSEAIMEEQTISRYLVKGGSPSLGGDTMQRSKVGNGVADTTDGRRGFQGRKSGGLSPDSYPGFALQNIESAQIQGSAEFNGNSGQKQAPIEVHSFDNRQSFQTQPQVFNQQQEPTFEQRQSEYETQMQEKYTTEQVGDHHKSRGAKEVPVLYKRHDQVSQFGFGKADSSLLSPPQIDQNASRPLRSKSPDLGSKWSPVYQGGDQSQDMSLALNERIQKLKNDLKGTTYPDNDAAKRRENNQVLLQKSPESLPLSLASRDLRCQIMRQTDETGKVLDKSRSRSPLMSPSDPLYELEAERARLESEKQVQIEQNNHVRSRSREDFRSSSPMMRAPPLRIKHRAQFPNGASPQSNMLIRDSTNS